jgi:PDZ domain
VAGRTKVKVHKLITLIAAGVLTLVPFHFAFAQQSDGSQSAQVGSQPGAGSANPSTAGQGGDDATLELAPQPGATMPKPGVAEIPGDRNFHTGEDNADVESNFRPKTENDTGDADKDFQSHPQTADGRRPYLGITVRYVSRCYSGGEEHGLEVLNVDPNSPAAQAGLHARSDMSAIGAAVTTLTGILPGGSILATSALGKTGAMGQGGDMVIAVDGERVRDQGDLQAAMARLKPGDTMYLQVIRPNGIDERAPHQTLTIAVKVGAIGEPIANAAPPNGFTH